MKTTLFFSVPLLILYLNLGGLEGYSLIRAGEVQPDRVWFSGFFVLNGVSISPLFAVLNGISLHGQMS